MAHAVEHLPGNLGRTGHDRLQFAEHLVQQTRTDVSQLVSTDPQAVIFTSGATDALNMAIFSLLDHRSGPNDQISTHAAHKPHVITTVLDHNAVRRPLASLAHAGAIDLAVVGSDQAGFVPAEQVAAAVTASTRLVSICHASNVTGAIQDVAAISQAVRRRHAELAPGSDADNVGQGPPAGVDGPFVLVDAAQTAGLVPIDMASMGIDLLAFSGHKALGGPAGVGVLCLSATSGCIEQLLPWRMGGTGGDSAPWHMPDDLPQRLEAGTLNLPGIAGLSEALASLSAQAGRAPAADGQTPAQRPSLDRQTSDRALRARLSHEQHLARYLLAHLQPVEGVTLYGPGVDQRDGAVGVVSFTVAAMDPQEVAAILAGTFDIAVRAGLHCAPDMHGQLGTSPAGTVRVSFGPETSEADVDALLEALGQLV